MAAQSGLQKLKIYNGDSSGKEVLFEAPYNPTELSFSRKANWKQKEVSGQDTPRYEFISVDGDTLDLELFLDTTSEPTKDLYSTYVSKLNKLILIDNEKHRPNFLKVVWGENVLIHCYLESVDYSFNMFNKSGKAIRGTAKLKFVEAYKSDGDVSKVKMGEKQSPDHTKVRVLRRGDSLQSIAYHEYEDVAMWKTLAEHNNIEDPMNIPIGTTIEVPAL